jgi:hypothetical protein
MSPFYDQYRRCIDQVRGIGEEQMEVGQQLTEAGMLDPHTLDAAATVCARS